MSVMNNQAMNVFVNDLQKHMHTFTESIVHELSKKYGFDFEEALRYLSGESDHTALSRHDLPDTTTTTTTTTTDTDMSDLNFESDEHSTSSSGEEESTGEDEEQSQSDQEQEPQPYPKTSYPLPFTGVLYDSCHGIRLQHSMFVQCPSKPMKNASHNLCKTCFKQSQSNQHGKPNCGLIEDRLNVAFNEFKDPRGKRPKPYVEVLKSLKLEIEDVKTEFQEKGIHIPEYVWEQTNKKEKKKEKKVKKNDKPIEVVLSSSSDEKSEDEDNEELVDTEVLEVQYNGVKYFQCDDKILYDIETRERIGIYSEQKNGVIFD